MSDRMSTKEQRAAYRATKGVCNDCGKPLYYRDELDFKTCNRCLDRQYEQSQERREFEYYHSEIDRSKP